MASSSNKKEIIGRQKSKAWIWIIVIIIVFLIVFVLPIFPKYEQQSYQQIINQDNCDKMSGCICEQHGGFLWLTCQQCSCTRYREVARYVTLWQLLTEPNSTPN